MDATPQEFRAEKAVSDVDAALFLAAVGASRQARRAQARRVHKSMHKRVAVKGGAEERPGVAATPMIPAVRRSQRGVYGKRITETHSAVRGRPYDAWFHHTKGWRTRLVAV